MVPIVLRRFEEDSKVSSQNYYRSLKVLSLKLILVVKMPSNFRVMWFSNLLTPVSFTKNWSHFSLVSNNSSHFQLSHFFGSFQTKRLFGHPSLVVLPKNILGKDVYSFISKLLPDAVTALPFTLHLVDQQVRCLLSSQAVHPAGVNPGFLNMRPLDVS